MKIGIAGKAGAGKNYLANKLLSKEYFRLRGFKEDEYATPIKQIVQELFGLTHDQLYTQEGKETEISAIVYPEGIEEASRLMECELFDGRTGCHDTIKIILDGYFKLLNPYVDMTNLTENIVGYRINPRKLLQIFGTEATQPILGKHVWVNCLNKRHEYKNVIIPGVRFLHEAKNIKDIGGIIIKINSINEDKSQDSHASEIELEQIAADYSFINMYESDCIETACNDIIDLLTQLNERNYNYDQSKG